MAVKPTNLEFIKSCLWWLVVLPSGVWLYFNRPESKPFLLAAIAAYTAVTVILDLRKTRNNQGESK